MTKEEAEALLTRYTTRTEIINRPSGWNYLTVSVLFDGEPVGTYQRNYSTLFDSFVPFIHADKTGNHHVLALYSSHYTATRLMRLPECEDIGGETPSDGGFCPTGFFVPYDPKRGLTGQFGFVSGCVWGDDSSWKIKYLDLSEAASGILRPDGRLGFLELPRNMVLRDAVNLELYDGSDEYGEIEFTVSRVYQLKKNHFWRDCDGNDLDDAEENDESVKPA